MSLSISRIALAVVIAFVILMAWGLSNTSHEDAANASWVQCSHQSQSVHELSQPPSAWPGTRAAHTVTRFTGTNVQTFYTKTSTWDWTWDYYKRVTYLNC